MRQSVVTKPGANGRAFDWLKYRNWRPSIMRVMADHLDASVLSALKADPPRHFVSDNLSWLDGVVCRVKSYDNSDIVGSLAARLPSVFSFIRAYHGCRTVGVDSYRKHGILLSNPENLKALARQLFSNKDQVEAAVAELAKKRTDSSSYEQYNAGKVYFCLTAHELVEDCGHYLLYGSEYLLSIANRVHEPEILRNRGRATIVECDIPIADIPQESVRELAGEILREICQRYADPAYEPEPVDFGFEIFKPLSPERIVAFHHPRGIPNPHNSRIRED